MEGSVKHRNLWHLRIRGSRLPNRRERRWVVQRRQMTQLLDLAEDAVIDPHRMQEALAAVHDTMDDGIRWCALFPQSLQSLFDLFDSDVQHMTAPIGIDGGTLE